MNLVLFVALLLTAVFLSALPLYANAIAGRNLTQTLQDAPTAGKNMLVQGAGLNAGLYGTMQDIMGSLLRDRVEVREGQMGGQSAVFVNGEERPFDEFLTLHAYSFSNLDQYVELVEGRWPQHLSPPPNSRQSQAEAVIGLATAQNLNLTVGVGNSLTISHLQLGDQLRSEDGSLTITIVGIVQPVDPQADVWWGDLLPITFQRIDGGNFRPDTILPSLIMPPASVETYFGGTLQWRVLTDVSQISVSNVEQVRTDLKNLETTLQTNLTLLDTNLIQLIETYLNDLATARIYLFLLSVQSLLFVLYTVAMISSFLVHQTQNELVTLAGRGFNSRQITGIFALQALLMVAVAGGLAPFLARLALQVWGRMAETAVSSTIPTESFILSFLALLFAWETLTASIFYAAQSNLLAWQRQIARPPQRARWQQLYLDFFLLGLGALVYWQLADTGSVATNTQSAAGTADPLLLLGPSLLLIAVALVFLRLFPALLRLVAWWTRRDTGLIAPLGVARLARDPIAPSQVILLVSLAAGLTLFANTFEHSLTARQTEMAHYLSGADVRVEIPTTAQNYAELADVEGVMVGSAVYLNRSRWAAQLGREANLVAVDPQTIAQATHYAPFLTDLTIEEIVPALLPNGSGVLPAVFSADAYPQDKQIGDLVTYIVGQHKVEFEVRGIIRAFPAVDSPFFLTNLAALETAVDLGTLTAPWQGHKELWLAVAADQQQAVIEQFTAEIANGTVMGITADSSQVERRLQSNLIALETLGAFNLNAFMLSLLSIAIFFMVNYFAAHQRLYEFSVLRSIGLGTEQLLSLLSIEGILTLVMGLLAGSGLGYGLAYIMRSFLAHPLAVSLGGDTIRQIVLDWGEIGRLYGLLIGFYALALGLLLATLLRAGIQRVLRIGEE